MTYACNTVLFMKICIRHACIHAPTPAPLTPPPPCIYPAGECVANHLPELCISHLAARIAKHLEVLRGGSGRCAHVGGMWTYTRKRPSDKTGVQMSTK